MVYVGLVIVGIAALVHLYIFFLESFGWTSQRARAVFGTTAQEAAATRTLAFNQGFYNLFLALQVLIGIAAFGLGSGMVGAALIVAGSASMALAGLVLLASNPAKASAAFKQLLPPLVGVIVFGIGLL